MNDGTAFLNGLDLKAKTFASAAPGYSDRER